MVMWWKFWAGDGVVMVMEFLGWWCDGDGDGNFGPVMVMEFLGRWCDEMVMWWDSDVMRWWWWWEGDGIFGQVMWWWWNFWAGDGDVMVMEFLSRWWCCDGVEFFSGVMWWCWVNLCMWSTRVEKVSTRVQHLSSSDYRYSGNNLVCCQCDANAIM